ncbi:MAG: hypothetical protein K9N62_00855 [Verrucomicrobia bacterium]|nr:hypothetical protein [Verrucomicrobiota bacterium]
MNSSLHTGRTPSELLVAARRFVVWLEREGYASYDPYDVWGTRYGLFARRLYYRGNPLGMALITPILLLEILCPERRSLFVKKQRYATADAQLLLAFLNLYEIDGDREHLDKAAGLGEDLLRSSIAGYRGHCWGYPFDWQTNRGRWERNTPFITATPYCFEAFAALHGATGEERYLEVAASVARFVHDDLNDTEAGPDAMAASYGPVDHTQVINASAYRAFVLFEAARQFGMEAYQRKAERNLNFILQSQRADGSWLYALASPNESFIDHFHTCFVLKNLFKLNRHLQDSRVCDAIERGWMYYRKHLFHPGGNPKSFSIEPRLQIARLEMYNVAEAITLGALLKECIPEAFSVARQLARRLAAEWQLPDGHFMTRVYLGGIRHTEPFLRWPQAQLFHALTNLLKASRGRGIAPEETGSKLHGKASQC